MNETIKKVSGTILEETVKLQVDIQPKNRLHALLQKWKWLPTRRILELTPIYFGTLIKISNILCRMDIDLLKSENLLNDYYQVMAKEGKNIATVIALAIVNDDSDPPRSLVKFILRHFKPRDMINTFSIVSRQMDVTNFIHSMVLMGKMNLHETSPKDQRSQIASGESLETLLSTSGSPGNMHSGA